MCSEFIIKYEIAHWNWKKWKRINLESWAEYCDIAFHRPTNGFCAFLHFHVLIRCGKLQFATLAVCLQCPRCRKKKMNDIMMLRNDKEKINEKWFACRADLQHWRYVQIVRIIGRCIDTYIDRSRLSRALNYITLHINFVRKFSHFYGARNRATGNFIRIAQCERNDNNSNYESHHCSSAVDGKVKRIAPRVIAIIFLGSVLNRTMIRGTKFWRRKKLEFIAVLLSVGRVGLMGI